jgi:hypothetical protein
VGRFLSAVFGRAVGSPLRVLGDLTFGFGLTFSSFSFFLTERPLTRVNFYRCLLSEHRNNCVELRREGQLLELPLRNKNFIVVL